MDSFADSVDTTLLVLEAEIIIYRFQVIYQ